MRSISTIVDGITLTTIRGRVMATQTWSETHVKGSGSAIMVKGIGAGSSSTTSTVANRREVCIEAEDGLQIMEAFDADTVKLMPDQQVTLVRASMGGRAEPVTVGIHNHGTRKFAFTGQGMLPGVNFLLTMSPYVTFFALIVMATASTARNPEGLLLIGGLLILGNLYWLRGSAIREAFQKRVREMAGADEGNKAAAQPAALRSA